ncbi:MAG: hypothetical protein GYA55_07960 [SAR324 cluster bacterium]|uniref:Uncharacterized protein n=1 Tax=SAR324 cluster bacterium TaxID=2024889 RepID=A0A7X9IJG6_9DELT|nr:hypothetical protein [SAR324 cluster bacterium]
MLQNDIQIKANVAIEVPSLIDSNISPGHSLALSADLRYVVFVSDHDRLVPSGNNEV